MFRNNPSTILRNISFLFCVIGLFYHTFELVYQYWQGKTVVSIKVGRLSDETFPAISLCYPYALSFQKLAKINVKYQALFEKYLVVLDKKYEDEEQKQYELMSIYKILKQDINRRIENKQLDFVDVLRNFSVNIDDYENDDMIKIKFEDLLHLEWLNNISGTDKNEGLLKPVESYDITGPGPDGTWFSGKCFTYFSALEQKWRTVRKSIKYLKIIVKYDTRAFPIFTKVNFNFAIHSPNTLPCMSSGVCMNDFLTLKKSYLVKYHQLSTALLGSNYDTNCFEYDPDHKHSNFNMRSDCLSWCFQAKMSKLCNSDSIFVTDDLFRDEVLDNFLGKNLKVFQPDDMEKVELAKGTCLNECREDCNFKYFSTQIDQFDELNESDHLVLYIGHDNLPDLLIKHIPEMTLISFVSNLGGLFGLWLGISFMVIFEHIIKLFNYTYLRMNNKVNIQNILIVPNRIICNVERKHRRA